MLDPPAPEGEWSTPHGDLSPSSAVARPRRRWPWVVVIVALLVGAGASLAVALDQRETAAGWRERALAVEGERDDALSRGDRLEAQVEELEQALSTSEQDVTALEERVRQLADEKAQAEDAATTTQVERDVVVDAASDIAAATEALDACVDRLFELQAASVEAFNRTASDDDVDVEALNTQARETTSFCNDARSAAARASAAAQQLSGP